MIAYPNLFGIKGFVVVVVVERIMIPFIILHQNVFATIGFCKRGRKRDKRDESQFVFLVYLAITMPWLI
jgi:hypothetical protein